MHKNPGNHNHQRGGIVGSPGPVPEIQVVSQNQDIEHGQDQSDVVFRMDIHQALTTSTGSN